jgi:hypothetical protein
MHTCMLAKNRRLLILLRFLAAELLVPIGAEGAVRCQGDTLHVDKQGKHLQSCSRWRPIQRPVELQERQHAGLGDAARQRQPRVHLQVRLLHSAVARFISPQNKPEHTPFRQPIFPRMYYLSAPAGPYADGSRDHELLYRTTLSTETAKAEEWVLAMSASAKGDECHTHAQSHHAHPSDLGKSSLTT